MYYEFYYRSEGLSLWNATTFQVSQFINGHLMAILVLKSSKSENRCWSIFLIEV